MKAIILDEIKEGLGKVVDHLNQNRGFVDRLLCVNYKLIQEGKKGFDCYIKKKINYVFSSGLDGEEVISYINKEKILASIKLDGKKLGGFLVVDKKLKPVKEYLHSISRKHGITIEHLLLKRYSFSL